VSTSRWNSDRSRLSTAGTTTRPLLTVAVNTGLLLGELLGLRRRDLYLTRGTNVRHQISGEGKLVSVSRANLGK
jgi:hypothetical protein